MTEDRFGMGRRCVRAFKIARNMALKEDAKSLVPHLAQMEDAFKRPRKTKAEREIAQALKKARIGDTAAVRSVGSPPPVDPATLEFKAGRDL